MTAPNPTDVELVAAAIWSSDWPDGQDWATAGATEPEYRANAIAVLAALEAAGRLVPPNPDTRTQWAVRKSSVPDGEGVGLPSNSREKAEFDRDRWLSHDRGYPVTAVLVQREVRNWPDGSCWVGPWVPVPTTPGEQERS